MVAEFDRCPGFPDAKVIGVVCTHVPAAASAGVGGAGSMPYPGCLLFDFRCCLVGLVKLSLSVIYGWKFIRIHTVHDMIFADFFLIAGHLEGEKALNMKGLQCLCEHIEDEKE